MGGRAEIVALVKSKWAKELDYRLIAVLALYVLIVGSNLMEHVHGHAFLSS